ncbi:DDE-type integrase/transposase/recombinase, partial [Lactococcus lactis]|uniref:DDE-type integrase/transposase/recombinase n=1 Tax=Lactococcus lactis TaxID=1358 RepID=UPI0022E22BF1
ITSAFKKLKEYGFYQGTEHRTIKYLNNLIEQDHRPVKRRNKFYRSLRTASPTIKGMEAIRGLYKKTRKDYRKGFYSLFKTLQQNPKIFYKKTL